MEANYRILSKNRNGICLVKASQNKFPWLLSTRMQPIIVSHLEEFCLDPFANFAIQQLLEQRSESHTSFFTGKILPSQFATLSMNKFASNVLDKVIKNCTKQNISALLNHLGSDADEQGIELGALRELVLSQFGNFPLQKLLNEALNYGDEGIKQSL